MKRLLAIILVMSLAIIPLCGCKSEPAPQSQGEGLDITFNDENGAVPQQTEPVEPLNKVMEKEDLAFKGDHYGVVINGATPEDIDAANIETCDLGGSETIIVMPYYAGSKVRVEKVVYDMNSNGIVPTETVYETTSTDDYALALKVTRPSGVMPEMRITVEYDGVLYSHLIKNVPDGETEYIR